MRKRGIKDIKILRISTPSLLPFKYSKECARLDFIYNILKILIFLLFLIVGPQVKDV